ncbi:MAG: STAS domain-containing protein [Erysipelotrichaceae bacterium]|nr:STAS domain-containing protein [Erysipelotrichaceae bacterium]
MEMIKKQEGNCLQVSLIGRLDTSTAPELEQLITNELDNITEFVLDFEKLEYISSAGLRVLLAAQKKMNRQGSMKLLHVTAGVMEVFEITGFVDVLTIE